MRVSVPGVPGVYYDTDAKSTAVTTALTAVGRRVPTPQRYAFQALPLLWSFDVDLREVSDDHPFQYLHPEGVHSLDGLTRDQFPAPGIGDDVERTLRQVLAVSRETERGIDRFLGGAADEEEGIVIDIDDEVTDA